MENFIFRAVLRSSKLTIKPLKQVQVNLALNEIYILLFFFSSIAEKCTEDKLRSREVAPLSCIAHKMKFSIKNVFSKPNPQKTSDLFSFTDEIFNEKLHFLCSDHCSHRAHTAY